MKNINWIFFTSFRYLKARKANRKLGPSFLAVAGIAIGVMALVSVLGVMNGFQYGFIEDIININSFHVRVYSNGNKIDANIINKIKKIEEVQSVLPFIDIQTLIKSDFSDFEAVNIRLIPGNIYDYDPSMSKQLNLVDGDMDLEKENTILIGNQLSAQLGSGIGDNISIISMQGTGFKTLKPADQDLTITGLFQSGYYNFDRSMGFALLSNFENFASGKENLVYGIKLNDRYKVTNITAILQEEIGSNYIIESWKDFNSSFFGALRTEKTAMMLVIGLIFIVVGVNIKHSLERSVIERKEEIGIFLSLGSTSLSIKTVFIIEGFIIGLSGATIGLVLGLFLTSNINSIFSSLDTFLGLAEVFIKIIISPFISVNWQFPSMFSANNFYISEVPVQIVYSEIIFVFLFAVLSSTWAAYSASKIISKFRPAEVLRYE